MKNQFGLLKTKRFLPLFATQFLGAFNDNLFKNALVILITFRLADEYGVNAQILITIVAGLFILPFFLFSATAGQIADKYEKSFLIHIIKFVEIILMVLTAISFYYTNLWALIILLFFMGAQSTFFGPLKFSILPQHLEENELVAGNGLISAGTYVAILTGTLSGGLFILHDMGRIYISIGIISVAILGYIASLFIPKADPKSSNITVDWNILRATYSLIKYVKPNKVLIKSILGISWFWFLGAVFLAQFPTYTKDVLGGNEEISTFFLVVFSVGVGIGSTLCNRLLSGKVSGKLIPFACIGLSASTLLLYSFSKIFEKSNILINFLAFIKEPTSWGITIGLLFLAIFGGIFSVPMYAIMQAESSSEHRARVVATLNVFDSFGMVLSALFVALMLMLKISIINIFLIMGIINLLITPLLRKLGKTENDNRK
ncbi:MAG: MFS transporter [Synergistaceae bacterium]